MEENADDYALGDEITSQIQVRKPAGIVVSTRLERDIADRLLSVSETSGKKLSQVVREAVLAYLEQEPHHVSPSIGTSISMGTVGGGLNAVFTVRNSVVTNSGLVDHTERLPKIS